MGLYITSSYCFLVWNFFIVCLLLHFLFVFAPSTIRNAQSYIDNLEVD